MPKKIGLTKQRKVVLEVIRKSNEHLTANQIFEEARVSLPSISFATVYNSLRFLRDEGMIAEKNFGGGASRFDKMTDRHDHAICSNCGKLVDLDLKLPAELTKSASKLSGFALDSIEVTFRGTCPDCA